jgi:Rho GDP-dissociation inhibitor
MSASDDETEGTPGYKVSKKVDMGTIMQMDAEDESLRKYKEALLGKALSADVARAFPVTLLCVKLGVLIISLASDDPRRVVIKEMRVIVKDRPGGDIVYDLASRGSEEKLKETPFTLKEKCEYKIQVSFKIQHEIVAGLKFINMVYRKGVRGRQNVQLTFSCSRR